MGRKKVLVYFLILALMGLVSVVVFNTLKSKHARFYLENEYYNDKGLTDVSVKELEDMLEYEESFILFVYNDFCSFSVPCDTVFDEASKKMNMQILQIPYKEFKKSSLKRKIKYAPSVIIFNKGKIVKYLDAEKDEDKERYQNKFKLQNWVTDNVYQRKEKN